MVEVSRFGHLHSHSGEHSDTFYGESVRFSISRGYREQ
jgi:hypothetical protein